MARRDLTNEEIEQMGRDNPGSAAEYLRLRDEELEAERQAERAAEDEERFVEQYVAAGGDPAVAKKALQEKRNEDATITAVLAEDASREMVRSHNVRSL
jgi:predicted AAA+ superfamily ATPase